MRIVAVRYARITAVSVKSGSRLGEKYWHTTSSYVESQPSRSNLDQNWLRGMGIVSRRYAGNTTSSVKPGSRLAERYMRIVSVCMNRSSVGQIWIQTG